MPKLSLHMFGLFVALKRKWPNDSLFRGIAEPFRLAEFDVTIVAGDVNPRGGAGAMTLRTWPNAIPPAF